MLTVTLRPRGSYEGKISVTHDAVERKYKGPPTYNQWKKWLEARCLRAPKASKGKNGKVNRQDQGYVAAGLLPVIGVGDVKVLCISCGVPTSLSSTELIIVGCVVEITEKEMVEVWKDHYEEVERTKYMPVSARRPGCLDCQMAYLKAKAAVGRSNRASGKAYQAWLDVEPRDSKSATVADYHKADQGASPTTPLRIPEIPREPSSTPHYVEKCKPKAAKGAREMSRQYVR